MVEVGAPLTGNRLGDTVRCESSFLSASALVCRVDRERVSPLSEDDMAIDSIAMLGYVQVLCSVRVVARAVMSSRLVPDC